MSTLGDVEAVKLYQLPSYSPYNCLPTTKSLDEAMIVIPGPNRKVKQPWNWYHSQRGII